MTLASMWTVLIPFPVQKIIYSALLLQRGVGHFLFMLFNYNLCFLIYKPQVNIYYITVKRLGLNAVV